MLSFTDTVAPLTGEDLEIGIVEDLGNGVRRCVLRTVLEKLDDCSVLLNGLVG